MSLKEIWKRILDNESFWNGFKFGMAVGFVLGVVVSSAAVIVTALGR